MAFDPISAALEIGEKLIDRFLPDPAAAAQAKLDLVKMQQAGELAQITGQLAVNQAEAANPSVFVSGARPFIMWVCGVGLAMQFLVAPILTWGAMLFGKQIVFPSLDMGTLLTLLGGLLGLGSMRTVEKINGVARQ